MIHHYLRLKIIPKTVGFALIFGATVFATALFITTPQNIAAQGPIQITDQSWEANFRDQLTFNANAESQTEITEADLFYRVVGQLATSRNTSEFIPGTSIEAKFVIEQADTTDPSYTYFPPGTELEYWWKFVDAEGNELKTEKETIQYLDNRYEWQSLQDDRLTLYWYAGDDGFGQALFDRANVALDTLETDIGISLENPIKIFIYSGHQDLLDALAVTAQEWTGGVAYTEFGVVVIGIRPNQLDWGLNAMTHEMSHLVIHQATDNPFAGLPRWLDEGIAVYNENRDELDEDFKPLFERAVANDELMTLRTLSSPFPADPMGANLAYGQSGAVVKYIVDTYGSDAMAQLLSIFAEGAIPDEALQEALGLDTIRLDNEFRASEGLAPLPGTEPAGAEAGQPESANPEETTAEESTAAEPEEETEAVRESEVAEPVPTGQDEDTSSTSAEPDTSAQTGPEETEKSGSPLSALPCVGGVVALLVMGWGIYRRF